MSNLNYGRTTKEFAMENFVKPATVLRRYSTTGNYFGTTPVKLPNGRLRWPAVSMHEVEIKKGEKA